MNKYSKAGLALLGIGGLVSLVSLLGGPNVFSIFSNTVSTLFPESEVAVIETEENKTQTEVPVLPKPEEEPLGAEEKVEEIKKAVPVPSEIIVPKVEKIPEATPQTKLVLAPETSKTPLPSTNRATSAQAIGLSSGSTGGGNHRTSKSATGKNGDPVGTWCLIVGKAWKIEKEGDSCGFSW